MNVFDKAADVAFVSPDSEPFNTLRDEMGSPRSTLVQHAHVVWRESRSSRFPRGTLF